MKFQRIALPALALGGAALLILPGRQAAGFSTIGGSLSAESQRDFRLFNNFADTAANNNTTIDAQFPGFDGAEEAIWKAGVEWGSEPHGDGSGDPLQTNLGDGGANFDFVWSGNASAIGGRDSNVVSAISSCGGGGTLAYTETPISNGWRMRFCDEWTWYDGPGDNPNTGNAFDIQGIATHELGHSLGLGHSTVNGATMFPSTSSGGSSNQRSIAQDDINGVQSIYGVKSTTKPEITSFTVASGVVTIHGSNFSPTGGQVWFTNSGITSPSVQPIVKVTNVGSTNGGTQIMVTIPSQAGMGDILVKQATTGHSTLSNAFPFDGQGGGGNPLPPTITSVTPSTIENLIPGSAETITISGTNYSPTTTIEIDNTPIAGTFTVVGATQLTFNWQPLSALGAHTLSVVDATGSDSTPITVVANAAPTLQIGSGDTPSTVSGTVPIMVGAAPGTFVDVLVSDSNVPSVLPGKISLMMGNTFQQIFDVGLVVSGGNGIASTNLPLSGVSNAFLYWQGIQILLPLSSNYPLQTTNLQTTFTP